MQIQGHCTESFKPVEQAFQTNFDSFNELGAAVCVYHNGVKAVDLWGGYKDSERAKPWEENTIVCMMSVGKAMAALCVHKLIDDGKLDPQDPVANYWPEFAQSGKEKLSVQHLLAHHAGLIYPDLPPGTSLLDHEAVVRALAKQAPEWPPGTKGAYHSATYGSLIGELVRRISGVSVGTYFAENLARPLNAEYTIGVDEPQLNTVATVVTNPDNLTLNAINDQGTPIGRAWRSFGGMSQEKVNSEYFRTTEFPSANGHGNARGVARIYAMLVEGGVLDRVRIYSEETISNMRREQWWEPCGLLDVPFRMASGFLLNDGEALRLGPGKSTFGMPGVGGSIGFGDPERRLAFSYCTNYLCEGEALGKRCESLIDAAFVSRI